VLGDETAGEEVQPDRLAMIFEFFDGVHVPVSVRADAIPVPASGSGRRADFVNDASAGLTCQMMMLLSPGKATRFGIISIRCGRRISPIALMLGVLPQWTMDVAPKLHEIRHESHRFGVVSC